MRVLCDRHHAGLLYSLQLLFEDRLGMELYVPVGHDWWDEGYWRFGEVFGDDRLAQQYLSTNHPWEDVGGGWFTSDTEFPRRVINGVTLEQFKELGDWGFVLASVQENQAGFARLARQAGAAYVLQVGNRGQRVDWSLDPAALVSAEAPIAGRGVVYHQEFEKDTTFAAQNLPVDVRVVKSFVNCMPAMPEQWATMQEAERLLHNFEFRVHGHDGRDGRVDTAEGVAREMATAGFGWHDKPQGDGFGHVIHYWASVGRPIVGHGRYYAGLMPEPLWEDGATCVDLDLRSLDEAAEEVRRIAAHPERHRDMCRRIRERADELLDFDAEELAIRDLLGL